MAEAKVKNGSSGTGVLAQVAARARVSTGTVSRVFNNSAQIPPETRSRVLMAARELGFRPRVGIRNKQIALVTEAPHKTVMGGYVNTLTQYLCYALSRANAGITMITEDRIGDLSHCWFDGVIGIAWEEATFSILKKLHNTPVVWFSDDQSEWCHTIYQDSRKTGRLAASCFLGKGHRKLAVIHDLDYTGRGWIEGMRQAMEEAGADPKDLLALPSSGQLSQAVKKIIDAGCTAVWVPGEDMKALEMNWLIQELAGKRIPEDISLLGAENAHISEFQRPSLSTIALPLREMAEKAAEIIMREESGPLERIEMPVRLIERNSVATR